MWLNNNKKIAIEKLQISGLYWFSDWENWVMDWANNWFSPLPGARNQYVDVNNPKPLAVPQDLFNLLPPTTTPASTAPQMFQPESGRISFLKILVKQYIFNTPMHFYNKLHFYFLSKM